MKKWMSLILATAMVLSLTACGGMEDVCGTLGGGESAPTSTPQEDATFDFGTTVGGTYENKFIGLGCTLGSDWSYKSDAEIRELNQMTLDMVGDELANQIENAQVLYDMAAYHSNQADNIIVTLEKLTLAQVIATNLETMYEQSGPQVVSALSNMGYANVEWTVTEATVGGKTFAAMKVTSTINEVPMYQLSVATKCGKYIASVAITTFAEDKTQSILDAFYLVD